MRGEKTFFKVFLPLLFYEGGYRMKKWLFYYGIAVVALLIAMLAFPQAVVLHGASLVPVFCLVVLLVFTSKWYVTKGGSRRTDGGFKFVKIKGEKGYFQEVHEKNVLPFEEDARRIWFAARLATPIFLPFIVFVSPWHKLWSLLLLVLFGVGILIYEIVYWNREAKKSNEREKKAVQEQQMREELGIWK